MSDLVKARRLLARTGAWIDGAGEGYALRIGANRRARVLLTFNGDEQRVVGAEQRCYHLVRGIFQLNRACPPSGLRIPDLDR